MSGATSGASFATLAEVALARAEELGDATAYVFLEDGESRATELGFRELHQRAAAMAATLQSVARPSDRFILALPPGIDYIVSFWSCLYASVWAVPLYPPLDPKYLDRMFAVLRDCEATGVITVSPLANLMKACLAGQGVSPESLTWITVDAPIETAASDWRRPAPEPDGIAFLQYTSGSTGEPKGVMVSHENLMSNSAILYAAYDGVLTSSGCGAELLNVSWLPPYHDAGLIDGILQTVYAGKTTVLMSPLSFLQRPVRWLRAISRYRATASGGPSFGYELCARKITDEEAEGLDLSSWVCSVNAAEPVRRQAVEAFSARFGRYGYDGRGLTPAYGLAEATLLTVAESRWGKAYWLDLDREKLQQHVVAEAADGRGACSLVSHGRPIGADAGLAIVDPDTRVRRGVREIGEIWLSGSSITRGYWGKPEATERSFGAYIAGPDAEGPFLRTGDLGFVGPEGELFVTGRIKDVIILRGKNHYPQDIEATASAAHAGFRRGGAAAFAIERDGAEAFAVLQEIRKGLDPAEHAGALQAARQAIAAVHGVEPADIVLVEAGSVPKTSSGKTERFKAREQYLGAALRKVASLAELAPADEERLRRRIERRLLGWIAEYADLDVQAVDRHARFDSFGIDSVRAVEMMLAVEDVLGAKVPNDATLRCHTVAEMAAFLAAAKTAPPTDEGDGGGDDGPDGFVVPTF